MILNGIQRKPVATLNLGKKGNKAGNKGNMKKEYDFSNGVRGKFANPEGDFNLPIYLEPEIADFVQRLSVKRDIDRSQIVNRLLKKDMEIIEL